MIDRKIEQLVVKRLANYPAVALLGARQSGKTTLAKMLSDCYYDLESESDRLKLDLEWDRLMDGDALVVLDEAQTFPEIFPRIRATIDRDRSRNGRFLLLSSVAPMLMQQVSESLAGRLSLVELHPFCLGEIEVGLLDRLWLCGGFPDGGILGTDTMPDWQQSYLTLLAQRDLPQWGFPAKPQMTERLFRMLAAVHGGVWNASSIAKSLGISYQTVNSYLDYLEGAYLVRRLHPYFSNTKKRLVKGSKVFWRDTGLLHSLLGVSSMEQLLVQPWVGASWESFVVEQVVSTLHAMGANVQPYFFRTSDRYEIDLILDAGGERWAIEVKLTSAPSAGDMHRLGKVGDMVGASRRILVSRTSEMVEEGNAYSVNTARLLDLLSVWE